MKRLFQGQDNWYEICFFFLLIVYPLSCSADDFYYELNSEKKIESRIFHKDNAYSDQKNTYATHLKSELFIEFKRNLNFLIEPYFRYDHYDKERTLLNISQGYLLYFNENRVTWLSLFAIFQ